MFDISWSYDFLVLDLLVNDGLKSIHDRWTAPRSSLNHWIVTNSTLETRVFTNKYKGFQGEILSEKPKSENQPTSTN